MHYPILVNCYSTDYILGLNGEVFKLDANKEAKVIFSYSPRAMNGAICLDVAFASSLRMATCMQGVKVWNTKPLSDVLYGIGGIKVQLEHL